MFVGHPGFVGENKDYFFAVRSLRKGGEGTSGLRVSALAGTIRNHALHLRRYLILDCCFSAAATKEFMGPVLEVATQKVLEDQFLREGTALLCSSSSRSLSLAPVSQELTMFSTGLMAALKQGESRVS